MNVDEAQLVVRLLLGYWPTPEMLDDELAVWTKELAPLRFDDASEVIELMATAGRQYRPVAGEFVAEYRQRTVRPKGWPNEHAVTVDRSAAHAEIGVGGWRRPCNHPDMALACKETTMAGLAECRRILASATGPMARSFARAIVPTAPIDPIDEEF